MIMRRKVESGVLTEEEARAMMNGVTLRPPRLKPWMWPTPRVKGDENLDTLIKRKGIQKAVQHNLKAAVQMWPTPTANEDACGRPGAKMQKMLGNHPEVRKPLDGGTLNPTWVEWLMGYPKGWTDLKD
jgi:DNA (cytosine-5)-methyltransferase 1